jgi:hypothetical protein
MFFAGYPDMGKCPSGTGHALQGLNFNLPYGTNVGQPNWQYCEKCHAMFYDGYPGGGRCPAGGGHQRQASAGINFTLPYNTVGTATAQTEWRYCRNCHSLFFNGFGPKGICPAGGGHIAEGLVFTLPHSGITGWRTSAADLRWFGVPIPMLATLAMDQFTDGFKAGAASQIPEKWIVDLDAKIQADPNGFKLGYAKGVLNGLLAGLKNLITTVVDLFQLAVSFIPPVMVAGALTEGIFMLTDPARFALRKRQIKAATRIAAAAKMTIEDIGRNPGDYLDLSREMGTELGRSAGSWFREDFLQKSAIEIGEIVGLVVGQVAFEIILAVVLELTTAGIGEGARAGIAVGQGAKGGSRFAQLVERLQPLLKRTKGLQRFIRELLRDERGALRIDAEVSRAVEAAFAEGAQFDTGVIRVIRVGDPGVTLTAEQLAHWRSLKGAGGLPQEFADVWTACANEAANNSLTEIRRLWALGDDASKLEARRLARVTYNNWRNRFMTRLRQPANAGLRTQIEGVGFRFGERTTSSPRLAAGTREVLTLDHVERVLENPARCIDPANLEFVIGYENSVTLEQLRNFTSVDLF